MDWYGGCDALGPGARAAHLYLRGEGLSRARHCMVWWALLNTADAACTLGMGALDCVKDRCLHGLGGQVRVWAGLGGLTSLSQLLCAPSRAVTWPLGRRGCGCGIGMMLTCSSRGRECWGRGVWAPGEHALAG